MSRLAFMTFGMLREPRSSPVVRGFVKLGPSVNAEAERAHGFIARAVKPETGASGFGQSYGEWGENSIAPAFYDGGVEFNDNTNASTLSLWKDIESVRRFAYNGLHKIALAQREKWFRPPAWPSYVMWWVADDHTPQWSEATQRIEHLHTHGPTPYAFSFKHPFDSDGRPIDVQWHTGE